jgi:hypothetical protein
MDLLKAYFPRRPKQIRNCHHQNRQHRQQQIRLCNNHGHHQRM